MKLRKPKIAVIYFPGNNCEEETLRAVIAAGMDGKILRWNANENLENYDGFIIPGGWSYEDRIRAGAIAAKEPIMNQIKAQTKYGKPLLGICNGAQILVESGIIPGLKDKIEIALAPNKNPFVSGYYNAWVCMKNSEKKPKTAFTNLFETNEVLYLPVAHGEGRFLTKDKGLLKELSNNGQIIFQYSTKEGRVIEDFPINPNGSMLNIAAVSNKNGNVMAIMPHPERAIWQWQSPSHLKTDEKTSCLKIFQSMKNYILTQK